MSADSTASPVIELCGIEKCYGGEANGTKVQPKVRVLNQVSLSIRAGEFVAIIGASGSGKSTLMNILGCLDRPSAGEYRFAGHDVAGFDNDQLAWLRRNAFGFIFQSYHLIPSESAAENVEVPALYAGLADDARHARSEALLGRLGLGERLDYLPKQLSGGQQQRVSIARALMNGGYIILADEPTGALDTASGAQVMGLLRELAANGHTIILITHDPKVADQAERVIEISDGRIVRDEATPAEAHQSGVKPDRAVLHPPDITQVEHGQSTSLLASIQDAARAARRSMVANPVRTALTLLGIIIGVAAVIVMLSVAEGAKRMITKEMGVFGTNLMFLDGESPSPQAPEGVISASDLRAIARLPEVDFVEPTVGEDLVLRYGNAYHAGYVRGNSADYPAVYHWPTASGRFFSHDEYHRAAAVAVIGHKVREVLFPAQDPLGEFMLIGQTPFQVVGVLKEKDNEANFDRNSQVVVPYTTAVTRLYGPTDPDYVSIVAAEQYPLAHTEREINAILLKLHGGVADFELDNYAASLDSQQKILGQLSMMLGAIAAISLLVGGIGVMNVMLKIGIRMATGARQRDIMRQFLTESVLVSLVGGVVGILLAFALLLLAVLISDDVPVAIVPAVVAGAFSCALVTGIVFGFTPARRAAQLDPVAALASE